MTDRSGVEGGGFGWRAWTVDEDAAGPVLASPRSVNGTPWCWSTVPMAATCSRPGHEPPGPGCECGISVIPSLSTMLEYLCGFSRQTRSVPHVVGRVRFPGPALSGYDGGIRHLRVASCEPVDVLVTVSDAEPYADALAVRYGLKVIVGRYSDKRWVLDDLSHLVGFWQDGDHVTLPDADVTRLGVRAA